MAAVACERQAFVLVFLSTQASLSFVLTHDCIMFTIYACSVEQ